MVRSRVFVVACMLASLVAATGTPASAGQEHCDVLKLREVKKAIGQAVRYTGPADGIGGECAFTVSDSPADTINVWVLEGDDAKQGYDFGSQLNGKKVKGIGDKAFYVDDPFNTLYVLDGDTLVYLQFVQLFSDTDPADIQRAVFQMTKKVLSRVT